MNLQDAVKAALSDKAIDPTTLDSEFFGDDLIGAEVVDDETLIVIKPFGGARSEYLNVVALPYHWSDDWHETYSTTVTLPRRAYGNELQPAHGNITGMGLRIPANTLRVAGRVLAIAADIIDGMNR